MVRSWFLTFIIVLGALLLAYYNFIAIGIILFLGLITYLIITAKPFDIIVLSFIFIISLFFFNYSFISTPLKLSTYNNYKLTGYVANYPTYDGNRASFIVKTKNQSDIIKKVQVFASFEPSINKGDYIEVRGKLASPLPPGNPGEFDYRSFLAKENIYYILNIKNPDDLKLLASNSNYIIKFSSDYRSKVVALTEEAIGQDAASILLGMLLGKKENIDENQYEDFQKTGIVHVFAVSGLHVGFLLFFCHGITSLLALSNRTRFYISIIVLLFYGTLVGWPISVIRASIMAGLGLLAIYIRRDRSLLDSLGLAGIIIILLDPYAPFKIAFQLSFVATWGLIYLYPLIRDSLTIKHKLVDYILIPLSAQIPTIPFIAYHFNLFTPISVITNILLGYIIGVIVIAGFALMIIALFSATLFSILAIPIGALIKLVIGLNHGLVNLPYAYIYVGTPHLLIAGIYFLGLGLIIYYLKNKFNHPYFISGLLLIAIFTVIICLPASIYKRGYLEVIAIDVGQGDSILIKSPKGKFILIDGGGSDFTDVGKRKVLAYLHHRGIRNLYAVINTHPDTDHLRGLETVLDNTQVEYIGIPSTLKASPKYEKIKEIARNNDIAILPLHKGHMLKVEESFTIEVIYPAQDNIIKSIDNDQSLVLLAKYRDFSILLTGDIEKLGIVEMLATYNLPAVTVLKIPHHGSKGSLVPELYAKTTPLYGVISVGKNNNFGHPHNDILEQLEAIGATALRTDEGGLIYVVTDGQKLEVKRPMAVGE